MWVKAGPLTMLNAVTVIRKIVFFCLFFLSLRLSKKRSSSNRAYSHIMNQINSSSLPRLSNIFFVCRLFVCKADGDTPQHIPCIPPKVDEREMVCYLCPKVKCTHIKLSITEHNMTFTTLDICEVSMEPVHFHKIWNSNIQEEKTKQRGGHGWSMLCM